MRRKLKILPVLLVIFILSFSGVILITNKANKIDIKDDVIRVVNRIEAGEPITEKNAKVDKISRDWLSGVRYIRSMDAAKGIYAKETLYPGDIIRVERVGSKNQLISKEVAPGFERISVQIDKPWNGVNYQYATGQTVALNCAVEYSVAKYLSDNYGKEVLSVNSTDEAGQEKHGTAVIRVIEKIRIVSLCDREGNVVSDRERENSTNKNIDSITLDVNRKDAFIIHILRNNRGVFEITKLPEIKAAEN